jgi:hypothetical protein
MSGKELGRQTFDSFPFPPRVGDIFEIGEDLTFDDMGIKRFEVKSFVYRHLAGSVFIFIVSLHPC